MVQFKMLKPLYLDSSIDNQYYFILGGRKAAFCFTKIHPEGLTVTKAYAKMCVKCDKPVFNYMAAIIDNQNGSI